MIKTAAARAFLIAALLVLTCTIALAQAKAPPADPTMKLQGLDGKVYDLAELRGSVVLISFGATWCAPCSTELHALAELLTEFRSKPVKFFWVSVERPEEINNAGLREYARERKLSFPVLRDTGQMVFFQFAEKMRLPMIVMLNRDGKVDAPATFGMKSPPENYKAEIRSRLNKLLTVSANDARVTPGEAMKRATTNALAFTPTVRRNQSK
jgi:peroxiredoxin